MVVAWYHVGDPCVCPSICPSIHFSFPEDTLSKLQWVFTKLGMCIDIVEIWFVIANGQITANFYSYLPGVPVYVAPWAACPPPHRVKGYLAPTLGSLHLGVKLPLGSLPPEGEDTLAWIACPPGMKIPWPGQAAQARVSSTLGGQAV